MTLQDRQIQLQDLCARVPYHPKGHVVNSCNGAECDEWLTCETFTMFTNIMNNARLYLRPMSSMTEEEKKSLPFPWVYNFGAITSYCESEGFIEIRDYECSCIIDWFNARHFDYRGLIAKGLAISTEEFNPYND